MSYLSPVGEEDAKQINEHISCTNNQHCDTLQQELTVGLSNKACCPPCKASSTLCIYLVWTSYGLNGKWTGILFIWMVVGLEPTFTGAAPLVLLDAVAEIVSDVLLPVLVVLEAGVALRL